MIASVWWLPCYLQYMETYLFNSFISCYVKLIQCIWYAHLMKYMYRRETNSKKKRWKEFWALLSKWENTQNIYFYFTPSKYYYSQKIGRKRQPIHEKRLVKQVTKIHIFKFYKAIKWWFLYLLFDRKRHSHHLLFDKNLRYKEITYKLMLIYNVQHRNT